MELLSRCLGDPGAGLEEGEVQGAVEQLKIVLSLPEPETAHIQLVADLGKQEGFREQASQLIEPLLAILKRDPISREVMQQVGIHIYINGTGVIL